MAASSKKKTTFAKYARETKLRERRLEKQARKDARKRASQNPQPQLGETPAGEELDADAVAHPPSAEMSATGQCSKRI